MNRLYTTTLVKAEGVRADFGAANELPPFYSTGVFAQTLNNINVQIAIAISLTSEAVLYEPSSKHFANNNRFSSGQKTTFSTERSSVS